MQRRDFLKSSVAVAVAAELGMGKAQAKVPAHNWGNYAFGSGPRVADRLNQGRFPQYPAAAVIPTDDDLALAWAEEDWQCHCQRGGAGAGFVSTPTRRASSTQRLAGRRG